MKPQSHRARLSRWLIPAIVVCCTAAVNRTGDGRTGRWPQQFDKTSSAQPGYVGSRACATCHRAIFDTFTHTDMGRSMSEVTPEFLAKFPSSGEIFDTRLQRHFDVSVRDGSLYQSESQTTSEGATIFQQSRKIDWIIGAGANGLGGLVARDGFLYEAPLSYYAKPHAWGLSPGYEFGDYGFNRPILPACIACHSGMPRAIPGSNGRFLDPPFQELAIGCENCHGTGEDHVLEMNQGNAETGEGTHSIVNPAKLTPWLASNICMACHQTGDGRVLKPGKHYRDFRPGTALDDTISIFIVPPKRDEPPQSDLLQHYFSMTLSKCYRSSGGKMSCISCHDPHVEPSREEVPAFYRARCLVCHMEKSCAVPLPIRQQKSPPDDCSGCHMPKRDIATISHSSLTNHRIVATIEEPLPEETFHLATPQLPDLVHLNAVPERKDAPPGLTVFKAYAQLMDQYPQYRARYHDLAKQLEATNPDDVTVLEALADGALERKSAQGNAMALRYFERAVKNGASAPPDFERLATLLIGAGRVQDAVELLQKGIRAAPFDVTLYRQLSSVYASLGRAADAISILHEASEVFPQDVGIQKLLQNAGPPRSEP